MRSRISRELGHIQGNLKAVLKIKDMATFQDFHSYGQIPRLALKGKCDKSLSENVRAPVNIANGSSASASPFCKSDPAGNDVD